MLVSDYSKKVNEKPSTYLVISPLVGFIAALGDFAYKFESLMPPGDPIQHSYLNNAGALEGVKQSCYYATNTQIDPKKDAKYVKNVAEALGLYGSAQKGTEFEKNAAELLRQFTRLMYDCGLRLEDIMASEAEVK